MPKGKHLKQPFRQALVTMVICGMLMAVAVAVKNGLAFYITAAGFVNQKLSLFYFVVIFTSIMFGPYWGALVGFGGDFLAFFLSDATGAPYFIGISIVAGICGIIPGLAMRAIKQKTPPIWLLVVIAFFTQVFCSVVLNTINISIQSHTPYWANFMARLPFSIVVGLLYAVLMPVAVSAVQARRSSY